MQMQMPCGVIRFVICFCMVGFTIAKSCSISEKCGSLEVKFPFWINKSECGFYDEYQIDEYQINCTKNDDTGEMVPFLEVEVGNASTRELDYYKISNINYSTGQFVINSSSLKASSCLGSEKADAFKQIYLPAPALYFSTSNKFVVVGCNITGNYIIGNYTTNGVKRLERSCVSSCNSKKDPAYCKYFGCCEITIPDNIYWINFSTLSTNMDTFTNTSCGFSTVMDPKTFTLVAKDKEVLSREDVKNAQYGLTVNWITPYKNCSMAKHAGDYSCSSNVECTNSPWMGHTCKCRSGFEGDGYSCTDIDECNQMIQCVEEEKGGICHNLEGSFNCSCAKGYKGDGRRNGTKCNPEMSNKIPMFTAIGCVSAFVAVSLGGSGFFWCLKKHYQKRARKDNFRCNGGDFLKQILPKPTEGKEFKIFSEDEIRKASQNYSDRLGSGSSGTVYKGVLAIGRAVAIKIFREFRDGGESEESMQHFVNEIVILWSLNHKNIVSLVGCCLETPTPLLVYEFVDGGTVFQQLHSGGLCWPSRLEIAMGSADALVYLHSELDHPIIHRDVKSSNILLAKSDHTPKVADFGMSRLLCGNDAHLTTTVMSTCGYMDPDYFGTGVLNDRSDVYSFGVFLAELITGQKPLSSERPQQEMLLSKLFLSKCDDNCLADILDPKIKEETKEDEVNGVAEIARECLLWEGSKRPSMIEVKKRLRGIAASTGPTLSIPSSHHQISSATQNGSGDI